MAVGRSLNVRLGDEGLQRSTSCTSSIDSCSTSTTSISLDDDDLECCKKLAFLVSKRPERTLRKSVSFVEGMVTDVALYKPTTDEAQKRAMHYTEEELQGFRMEFIRLKSRNMAAARESGKTDFLQSTLFAVLAIIVIYSVFLNQFSR